MKTVNTKGMTIFQPSCGNYDRGIVRKRSYLGKFSEKVLFYAASFLCVSFGCFLSASLLWPCIYVCIEC